MRKVGKLIDVHRRAEVLTLIEAMVDVLMARAWVHLMNGSDSILGWFERDVGVV